MRPLLRWIYACSQIIIARPNDFGNRKQKSFTAEHTEIAENETNPIE
jgi:hypothetical protein